MKINKKILYGIGACVLSLVLLFIGFIIGGNSYTSNDLYDDYGYAEDADYVEAEGAVESKSLFTKADGEQKLVYNGDVTIGTDNINKSYKDIAEKMKEVNATFESVNESNYRKIMVIRVPKDKFMEMYESLSEVKGSITNSNISITDETKNYTDNKKRIDILETEYSELKELMKKAKNVKEILSVRDRMTEVTYELESLKGTNETIDYDVNFSRLTVTLTLTGTSSPVSFWYQIKEAFGSSIDMIKGFFLFLIEIWWLIAIVAGGIVWIRRWKRKKVDINKES